MTYSISTPAADAAVAIRARGPQRLATEDRLVALRSVAVLLGSRRASTVLAARAEGMSWQDIADRLGMSRQSVWDRYAAEDHDPPPPARGRHPRARTATHTFSNCAAYKAVTNPPVIRRTHMVKTVDDAAFDAEVLASKVPVLVEFGAAWCPPCRMLAPILDEVADERSAHLEVRTVDVDANPVIQGIYGVMSLPTLLLFVDGKPVRQTIGFMSKGRLLAFIDEALDYRRFSRRGGASSRRGSDEAGISTVWWWGPPRDRRTMTWRTSRQPGTAGLGHALDVLEDGPNPSPTRRSSAT